jgi:probable HAF family extracellular repeat protein
MFARKCTLKLLFSAVVALPLLAQADPRYTVSVLGGPNSSAADINNAGAVVGRFSFGGTTDHAFLYSGGSMMDLGTLGGAFSAAARINDAGQVAGSAEASDGRIRAFLYSSGSMADLGTLGGLSSSGWGINNGGDVVGAADTSAPGSRAFLLPLGGTMQNLGTLPSTFGVSSAKGINSLGQVVGGSSAGEFMPPDSPYHAFLYSAGVMTDLGTFGGNTSEAAAINDFGQVVGAASTPTLGLDHAFLYSAGVMHDLGTFAGGDFSAAQDINNRGQVVGVSNHAQTSVYTAFLYEAGVMLDLNELIDTSLGWTIYGATGINEQQQIAANGCREGACYALRLDPVPEPESYAMLLAGLALLGFRARKN